MLRGGSVITVIPARGSSKGIIRKNLQKVNGETLVDRSIQNALKIPENIIYLSSDDIDILKVAENYGVRSLMRTPKNATDFSTSESVIEEVLTTVTNYDGLVTLLQPTSPFIDIQAWIEAISILEENLSIGSIFAAGEKNSSAWGKDGDVWEPINHSKKIRLPRQLRKQTVIETGAFYVFRYDLFRIEKTRFCGNTIPIMTSAWSHFEIDSLEDLKLCDSISATIDKFTKYKTDLQLD